ncbi:hypothetical protein [Candidatus Hakubella thermalkaliphila]|uniref:hypothetical protein n=1 Tax=Candidatus Hakubella thermalkaliphila TaxID=2754717 RepID=UPI00159333B2|nr:hypothetical protein [Candidatus Hakubella thermalkaliphila]
MKVYLDSSVIDVFLFGEGMEAERYAHVKKLFQKIDDRTLVAVISFKRKKATKRFFAFSKI